MSSSEHGPAYALAMAPGRPGDRIRGAGDMAERAL
jgi:hypothetical protein